MFVESPDKSPHSSECEVTARQNAGRARATPTCRISALKGGARALALANQRNPKPSLTRGHGLFAHLTDLFVCSTRAADHRGYE